jgi:ADP-ribose pyrophosphatase YjhB (NUDIX family)
MPHQECGLHRLVADVCLVAGGNVLLTRYKNVKRYDGQAGWFLPDDLIRHMEHPDDAARRILSEQLEIAVPTLTLNHIESFGNGRWHLVFHYRADLDSPVELRPSLEVTDASWFQLNQLPEASDVAHGGWALELIARMLPPESRSRLS